MSDDEVRLSLAEAFPGMTIAALPEKWNPLEALVLIKCLDEEGVSTWCYRTTSPPNREELLGALRVQTALLERELLEEWEGEDEDEED